MAPGIRFLDESMVVSRDAQRHLLKFEGMTVKQDDPLGLAGTTARVSFTWSWSGGPLGQTIYHTTAKLHQADGAWKVYEDDLREALWRVERGQDE